MTSLFSFSEENFVFFSGECGLGRDRSVSLFVFGLLVV
jgi:hypothetical protein